MDLIVLGRTRVGAVAKRGSHQRHVWRQHHVSIEWQWNRKLWRHELMPSPAASGSSGNY